MRRRLLGPDLQALTPRRRLRHDLLYAFAALPFALLLGLLLNDDITDYPLTFGATWAVLETGVGVGRYLTNRER